MANRPNEDRITEIFKKIDETHHLAENQKMRLDLTLRYFGIIITILFALGVFNTVRDWAPQQKIYTHQKILAKLFISEIEEDIVNLARELTLSSITESQRNRLTIIKSRFTEATELIQGEHDYPIINKLLEALEKIVIENKPGDAISSLIEIEQLRKSAIIESLTLVLLGVAHHYEKEDKEGKQSYSLNAEKYFSRAVELPNKIGLAYNGLAVQKSLRAFNELIPQEKIDEALGLLEDAEKYFRSASDLDGTLVSYYKNLNNTTFIKAVLLGFYLDGAIDLRKILSYSNAGSIENFINQIDEGWEEVERFAHGSSGAPTTAAECLSIIAEYYKKNGRIREAELRLQQSKDKYIMAIKRGLYWREDRDQIEKSLNNNRLLQLMLKTNNNFTEILSLATG